jgi:hypothetical protein
MKSLITQILSKITREEHFSSIETETDLPLGRVIHQDEEFIDLEKYRKQPRSIKTRKEFWDLKSFVSYINRYKIPIEKTEGKSGQTCIFVSLSPHDKSLDVFSCLDYHYDYKNPSHGTHEAILKTPQDDSFLVWLNNDNTWLNQKEMIDYIKRYSSSFSAEQHSIILEAIQNIQADIKTENNVSNQSNKRSKSTFFKLITDFEFVLKPFVTLPFTYKIKAELSAQFNDREMLMLKYTIKDPHLIIQQAASDLREELSSIKDALIF